MVVFAGQPGRRVCLSFSSGIFIFLWQSTVHSTGAKNQLSETGENYDFLPSASRIYRFIPNRLITPRSLSTRLATLGLLGKFRAAIKENLTGKILVCESNSL